jgi:hypothetical protein
LLAFNSSAHRLASKFKLPAYGLLGLPSVLNGLWQPFQNTAS